MNADEIRVHPRLILILNQVIDDRCMAERGAFSRLSHEEVDAAQLCMLQVMHSASAGKLCSRVKSQ